MDFMKKKLNRKSSFIHWYFLRKWKDSMAGLSKLDIYWWYFHTFRDCFQLRVTFTWTYFVLNSFHSWGFTNVHWDFFGYCYWKRNGKDQALLKMKILKELGSEYELTLTFWLCLQNCNPTILIFSLSTVKFSFELNIQYHLLTFRIPKFWNNQSALRHYQWQ